MNVFFVTLFAYTAQPKNMIWLCIRLRIGFSTISLQFFLRGSINPMYNRTFAFKQRIVVLYTHLLSAFIINEYSLTFTWFVAVERYVLVERKSSIVSYGLQYNQFMTEFYVSRQACESFAIHVDEQFYVNPEKKERIRRDMTKINFHQNEKSFHHATKIFC